jgi:hypothetical protein
MSRQLRPVTNAASKLSATPANKDSPNGVGGYGQRGTLPRSAGNTGGRVGNAVETRRGCSWEGQNELMQQAG